MEREWNIQLDSEKHGGKIRTRRGKSPLTCYTAAQLKAFHPAGNYKIIGECIAEDARKCAGNPAELFQKGKYSRVVYARKGYLKCGENRYIAILKNVFVFRLIAVICCFVLCAGAVLAVKHWPFSGPDSQVSGSQSPAGAPDIDENARDYKAESQASQSGKTNAGQTQIPGYDKIIMDASTKKLNITLFNPEENSCYFVIHLVVDGKEVYATKMIPPGKAVYDVGIEKSFKKGTYEAVLQYECYHTETLARLNGANVKAELVVQ